MSDQEGGETPGLSIRKHLSIIFIRVRRPLPATPSHALCFIRPAIQGKFDAVEGNFVEVQSHLEELEKEKHLLSEVVGAIRGPF